MKVSSAAPVSEGMRSGRVTWRAVRHFPAPRLAAASRYAASNRSSPARVNR